MMVTMNQARLDLAGEFPNELAGLRSEQVYALEQALANAWHEGWQPNAADVALLASSLREGVDAPTFMRRVVEAVRQSR